MKESTIKEVREEYNRIKKETETLLAYKNELTKLIKNKKVQRFLQLSKLVDEDYNGPSEETMIMRAYQGIPEAFGEQNVNSNHIMIYMGSYIANHSREDNDYITYEGDPNTSYKSYMDLETTEWLMIDKDKCLEFETEYLVLYLHISEYSAVEYHKQYCELQKWFKEQLIYRSQPDVIKEMQEKYERKHKASFHKTMQ